MEQVFGYDVGVYDKTEGKKASNKSIKELKQEAHRKGSGNRRIEEASSSQRERS